MQKLNSKSVSKFYRPDVDGLRAIAILPVLFFHAYPSLFEGGFVGVDIFFVISGYLITTLIYGEMISGKFTFKDFYSRRIRRIFPALILLLMVTFFSGWFFLLPNEFEQLGKHIFSGVAFVQNFTLWQESGYFDKSSELKPLMHLWSLAIEEQFYLVFPLILWVAWIRKKSIFLITLSLTLISFFFNIYSIKKDGIGTFYLPHTRFWEILAGSLLSQLQFSNASHLHHVLKTNFSGHWLKNFSAFLGLSLIFGSIVTFNSHTRFPGYFALLPVMGTLMVILAGPNTWINQKILSNKILVSIGLISYPLYLWHWPIISLTTVILQETSTTVRSFCLVLSFLFAWGTHKFVEKPIRYSGKKIFAATNLSFYAVILGGVGLVTFLLDGVESRFPIEVRNMANYQYDFKHDARLNHCWIDKDKSHESFDAECGLTEDSALGRVVVWGDSHAARLYPGIKILLKSKKIAQFTRDSCPPILDVVYENCRTGNKFILNKLNHKNYDTVVLFAVWSHYTLEWNANSEFGIKLKATIKQLQNNGIKHIFLIGPSTRWTVDLPKLVYQEWQRSRFQNNPPDKLKNGFDRRVQDVDRELSVLARNSTANYLSIYDVLCDPESCRSGLPDAPSKLMTWDYGHLTTEGAYFVSKSIFKKFSSNNF